MQAPTSYRQTLSNCLFDSMDVTSRTRARCITDSVFTSWTLRSYGSIRSRSVIGVWVQCLILLLSLLSTNAVGIKEVNDASDGFLHLTEGQQLFRQGLYNDAAPHFWQAILSHSSSTDDMDMDKSYSIHDTLLLFIECYAAQGKRIDSFLYIARESFRRRQYDIAEVYVKHALTLDANNKEAQDLQQLLTVKDTYGSNTKQPMYNLEKAIDLYRQGQQYFESKQFAAAAKVFDEACEISGGNMALGPACTNAVYCRANIMDWGYNGTQFVKDMQLITQITLREIGTWRSTEDNGVVNWKQSTSVHPHMMLGYPDIDPMLKLYVAESFAIMDERMARIDSSTNELKQLPAHLPYNQTSRRTEFALDAFDAQFKIRVGFVSSGFNSKAVLYLAHNIFQFFDPNRFEIHVFSLGSPDSPSFIQFAMRGT